MGPCKKTTRPEKHGTRTTVKVGTSTDSQHPIWSFERIDRDGEFAFNPNDSKADPKLILQKLIDLSGMTWQAIKQQTHDKGQSKNHFITDIDRWSPEARSRFSIKCEREESDSVFSIALTNCCRLIGIRDGRVFYVIWFDSHHKFYPVG